MVLLYIFNNDGGTRRRVQRSSDSPLGKKGNKSGAHSVFPYSDQHVLSRHSVGISVVVFP